MLDQSFLKEVDELIVDGELEAARKKINLLSSTINPSKQPELYLQSITKSIEISYKLGSYSESVKTGEDLLLEFPEILLSNKKYAVEFYMNLGYSYHLTQSNNDKGLTYLNQALSLYHKLNGNDKKLKAKILRYQGGGYYYKGDYETSINKMRQCLELLDPSDKTTIAVCHRSIGNSYWGLRDYQKASASYERSLDILYSADPVDSMTIGQVLHAKGYIHMDQGDISTAYQTFRKASDLLAKTKPSVSSPMVWVYGDVGRSLIDLKKYDSSLIWLQKALNANVFEYQQDDYYQNPPLVDINDDFQHFMILKLKGQAFLGKYLNSKNQRDLEAMLDCFQLADKQIDQIRLSIPKTEDQSTIAYYSTELYSKAIDALVTVFEGNSQQYLLHLAHYFMEKRKITRVHLRFLEVSSKSKGLLPENELEKDQKLLDKIAMLKTKLREHLSASSDSTSIIRNKLFEANEVYEKFISSLKQEYPAYHKSRFDLKVISADQIQNYLETHAPSRAIITYYNFRKKLRISVLTKDTIVIRSLDHSIDLDNETRALRAELIDIENQNIPTGTLSTLLIGSIEDQLEAIKEITFVMDPALQLVPMELMSYKRGFLLEYFDISYHFSSTLLVKNGSHASTNNFAGFAPSHDSLSIASLPGAMAEVNMISDLWKGLAFSGDQADEATFKQFSKDQGLIHVATHAIIDEQNPDNSYLQFSSSKSSSEDGRLYFFEIYNMKTNAQLITLSACNTGFGLIRQGEGVMSLSRAFAYAGVPATVVSLWPASDKSTPELMKYFYQNLKNGQSKDVALNNARKSYLATAQGKARHPFYWGGFVLIGDNSPIEEDSNLLVYIIPSVLVIVMILTVYRRRKKVC